MNWVDCYQSSCRHKCMGITEVAAAGPEEEEISHCWLDQRIWAGQARPMCSQLANTQPQRQYFWVDEVTGDTCTFCYVLQLSASVTHKGHKNHPVLDYSHQCVQWSLRRKTFRIFWKQHSFTQRLISCCCEDPYATSDNSSFREEDGAASLQLGRWKVVNVFVHSKPYSEQVLLHSLDCFPSDSSGQYNGTQWCQVWLWRRNVWCTTL